MQGNRQVFQGKAWLLKDKYSFIKDIRGIGLINGLEMDIPVLQ
jgi:4-aminobutyrate aminotransferase-like enzyme